jgi:signal transduction histidine kinase
MAAKNLGERLRAWRTGVSPDLRVVTRRCLEDTCSLFQSGRGVIAFEESEEPFVNIAALHDGEFSWRDESPESYSPLVAPELEEEVFVLAPGDRVTRPWRAEEIAIPQAVHPRIASTIGESILAIPIRGDSFSGYVFVAMPEPEPEDLWACAEGVGRLVTAMMEASAAMRDAVHDAISEERVRVGRDLHDGILQSFTGVVLQLETIHSLIDSQPDEAQRLITQAQGSIMSDQRDLRRFVETLRPRAARTQMAFDLAASLEEMGRRFDHQWGVKVAFSIDHLDPVIGASIGHETFRLIQEAITNSAKHGTATKVCVNLRAANGRMSIEVTDNGTGFPFQGRMSLQQIRATGHGPSSLAERVALLNGELTVSSSEAGASVEISIPLGFVGT